tara:strand:+ start:992 stop:1105 length:114 start_codon:yes stop_codon:yes gene_type:complete
MRTNVLRSEDVVGKVPDILTGMTEGLRHRNGFLSSSD